MSTVDTEVAAMELLPPFKARSSRESNEADVRYTLLGVGRFRVNVYQHRTSRDAYPWSSPSANRAARSNGCSRYPVKIQTSRYRGR
jgi:hypothetical protein